MVAGRLLFRGRDPWDFHVIPRSILRAHWSAADHGTALMTDDGGGLISSWKDRINGIEVTAAGSARPLWSATAMNEAYPGIIFDAVDDCFVTTALTLLPTGSTAGWIMVGIKPNLPDAASVIIRYGSANVGLFRGLQIDTLSRFQIADGNNVVTDSHFLSEGNHVILAGFSGTTGKTRINGNAGDPETGTIDTLNTGTTRLRIGANTGNSAGLFYDGAISDVLIGVGELSEIDKQHSDAAIFTGFGMRSSVPKDHIEGALHVLDGSIDTLWHIPLIGQSNSIGVGSRDVIDVNAIEQGRASMFIGGIRTMNNQMGHEFLDTVIDDALLWSIVDMKERDDGVVAQTPVSRIAMRLLAELPPTTGLNMGSHGIGGCNYAELKLGTAPFTSLINGVERLQEIGRLSGFTVICPAVIYIGGEDDARTQQTKANYTANMLEYQRDFDSAIRGITGQEETVKLFVDQEARYIHAETRLGQLQAAIDEPDKVVCLGPKYHLENDGEVHYTADSTCRRGAEWGRCLVDVLINDITWSPLIMESAVLSGNQVVITFTGNTGNIQFDTSIVQDLDDGFKGIEWYQGDDSAIDIQSVAVTSSNQITVTLTGSPATSVTHQVAVAHTGESDDAGPLIGPRSCIRDNDPDTEVVDGDTHHLYKYAAAQVIDVTT